MSFYFDDNCGWFPFCIPSGSGIWDQSTYFSGIASMSSTEWQPVVGPGTYYPVGMNLQQASEILWNCTGWKVNVGESSVHITIDSQEQCLPPPAPPTNLHSTRDGITPAVTLSSVNGRVHSGDAFPPGITSGSILCGDALTYASPDWRFSDSAVAGSITTFADDCNGGQSNTTNLEASFSLFILPAPGSFISTDPMLYPIYKYRDQYYPYLLLSTDTQAYAFCETFHQPITDEFTIDTASCPLKIQNANLSLPYYVYHAIFSQPGVAGTTSASIDSVEMIPFIARA